MARHASEISNGVVESNAEIEIAGDAAQIVIYGEIFGTFDAHRTTMNQKAMEEFARETAECFSEGRCPDLDNCNDSDDSNYNEALEYISDLVEEMLDDAKEIIAEAQLSLT